MRNRDGAEFEGFGEWADLSEALMRGLSHALTNRISSIGSFVTLHGMGDTEFTVESFLPRESAQLQQLSRALRLLVIDEEVSAIELAPLLRDAVELYSHHGRMHTLRCGLAISGEPLMPIRVIRSAMLRLVVILLDLGAAEALQSGDDELPLRLEGTEEELALFIPCSRSPTPYAMKLAEEAGSTLLSVDGTVELRVPTLVALKTRQLQ